jgi:cbb3-type cytochrome oxidase subunit 1
MDSFVRQFIKSSLVWLGIGVVLGVLMAFLPAQISYLRSAHMHANLLGFVSMMIFGVAYHVLPRFVGRALFAPRLARLHVVIANAGLLLQVAGWISGGYQPPGMWLLRSGGALSATGAFLFIYNIWRTLGRTLTPLQRAMNQPRGVS